MMIFFVLVYAWSTLCFVMKELLAMVNLTQSPAGMYVMVNITAFISGALSVPLKEMKRISKKLYFPLVSILIIITIALIYIPTFILNKEMYCIADTSISHMFNLVSWSVTLIAITIGQSIARFFIEMKNKTK